MSSLLPFLVTGFVAGALYGLAGLGLVLTYRTSGVLNLAHGAVAAVAAAIFYTLHVEHGMLWPFAVLITITLFAGIGWWLMERIARSLAGASATVTVVATVGLLLAINGGLNLVYGTTVRRFPEFLPTSGFVVAGVSITWGQVIAVGLASSAAVLLYLFLQRSRLGISIRAVVDDSNLVALAGTAPTRVCRAAWAVGTAFAAVSGVLLAPSLGLDANLLTFLVVQAFGACAIGRFSSLPMTYVGGLLVGMAAAVATRYLTTPPWNGIPGTVPYLALIVVLLVVPVSKLPQFDRGSRSVQRDATTMPRQLVLVGGGALLLGLLLVPRVVGTNLPVWSSAVIYMIVFSSIALLVWMSGQLSLCHMAFVAVGATTFAKLQSAGAPWGLALVGGALAAVPIGALVAVPAIRLSGVYLALLTLGFGIFMQSVIYQTDLMFGATLFATGTRPSFGPISPSDSSFYYVCLAVAIGIALLVVAIARTGLGLFLRALAGSPTMLATHGLGVNVTRLLVFCISAFVAALGGGLFVSQSGTVSGVTFGPLQSMVLVAVLAMCGTSTLRSPVLAAALFAVLPAYVSGFTIDQQLLVFGLAAIVAAIILARRRGITDWVEAAVLRSDQRRTVTFDDGGLHPHELQPFEVGGLA